MKIRNTALQIALASAAIAIAPLSSAALNNYSADFEGAPLLGSTGEGWLNFIDNGFGTYGFELDGATQVATIASGEGGPAQGNDHLNVFNNYDDASHNVAGNTLTASVFQQQNTSLSNVGQTWRFSYDAKAPSVAGGTAGGTPAVDAGSGATAEAFISGFGPGFSFFFPIYDENTAALGDSTWTTFSHDVTLTSALPGDWDNWIIQFGFRNSASDFADTGVLYDNVSFELVTTAVPVPAAAWLMGSALLGLAGVKRSRK